jgi:O-acetylserine/cysteine efflux transporter
MTRRQILLALLPPLFFGTGFTIAKPAVSHFPPLFLILICYGSIAVLMGLTQRERLKTPWPSIMLIAAFSVTIQGALLFWAIRSPEMPATAANLILQIQIPFAVLLGWLLMNERPDGRRMLGTALAILGVALVIGLPETPPGLVPTVMIIVSALCWSLGQVLVRRLGKDNGVGVLWQSVVTATWLQWSMLGFVAVVGFYFAYLSWFTLLKQCRLDEASPFLLLMPVVGIVTAALVLGESVSLAQLVGGAVILLGLAIVSGLSLPRLRSA